MAFKDIPPTARPREKLLALGPSSLADAELVALLLRTGLKGTTVLQLAQQLLDGFKGLSGLLQAVSFARAFDGWVGGERETLAA